MKNVLNITNGDSAIETMKEADISGEFLPWRDVLHDGPVPADLSLEDLSEVRAQFISDCGWGDWAEIQRGFIERDSQLRGCNEYEKILLWFEHDLYDQLQILQILDWFHHFPVHDGVVLSLICTDRYLGWLSADEMVDLFEHEEPIVKEQLILASQFWTAFRSPSPEYLNELTGTDSSVLPFLKGAIGRLEEEFPSTFNGLSRTEQQALTIIEGGTQKFGQVFGENQKLEERVFMGDSSFRIILNEFLQSTPPLLTMQKGPGKELSITLEGRQVLSGERNWLDIMEPDKWIGGVHLTTRNSWCWDQASMGFVKRH